MNLCPHVGRKSVEKKSKTNFRKRGSHRASFSSWSSCSCREGERPVAISEIHGGSWRRSWTYHVGYLASLNCFYCLSCSCGLSCLSLAFFLYRFLFLHTHTVCLVFSGQIQSRRKAPPPFLTVCARRCRFAPPCQRPPLLHPQSLPESFQRLLCTQPSYG